MIRARPIALAMAVLPIAVLLAGWSFAAAQGDPTAHAESRFLAFSLALGVAAAIGLEHRRGFAAVAMAGFGLLTLWTVGTGPARGAAMTAVLAGGIALAAAEGWRRSAPRLDALWICALAFAIQVVARPQLLLQTNEAEALIALLVLPLLAGAACLALASVTGREPALMIMAVLALCGPGWHPATVAMAIAVTAATLLQPAEAPLAGWGTARGTGRWGTVRWGTVRWGTGRWRIVAGVSLVAAMALFLFDLGGWKPALGALLAAAAIAQRRAAIVIAGAAAALTVVAAHLAPGTAPLGTAPLGTAPLGTAPLGAGLLAALAIAVLLAASLLPSLARIGRDRLPRLAAGVALLAFAHAGHGSAPAVLAGGLAVLVFALPADAATLRLQGWWLGLVASMTAFLAAYPWVDRAPLDRVLDLLGLTLRWPPIPIVISPVLLVCGAGWLLARGNANNRRRGTWTGAWAAAGVGGLALIEIAANGTLSASPETFIPEVVLSAERTGWRQGLATTRPLRRVTIDSSAIASLSLEAGRPIADVLLVDEADQTLAAWPLALGRETAEWAAERPDVAARFGSVKVGRGLAFVAPGSGFFGRRFRAHLRLDAAAIGAMRVIIRRRSDLPPEVALMVYRVEVGL